MEQQNIIKLLKIKSVSANSLLIISNNIKILENAVNNISNNEEEIIKINDKKLFNFLAKCYTKSKNYELTKKYYLLAIELGHISSMNDLGYFYDIIEKNNDMAIKYYLMAVQNKNNKAMFNLGRHYEKNKNYDLMKKYYDMALENNNKNVAFNYGYHYQHTEKNPELMKKYYEMAISKYNDATAMNNLGSYYGDNNDPVNMVKYYSMAVNNGDDTAMYNLGDQYGKVKDYENMIKYLKMAVEKNNVIAMARLCGHYFEIRDNDNTIKYGEMAIKHGDKKCKAALGLFYFENGYNKKAKKYLIEAFDDGHTVLLNSIIATLMNMYDYDNLEKYIDLFVKKHGYFSGYDFNDEELNILVNYVYCENNIKNDEYLVYFSENTMRNLSHELCKKYEAKIKSILVFLISNPLKN